MAISMQELSLETAEFLPEREVMSVSCRPSCQPEPVCPPPPCCGGDTLISVSVKVRIGCLSL